MTDSYPVTGPAINHLQPPDHKNKTFHLLSSTSKNNEHAVHNRDKPHEPEPAQAIEVTLKSTVTPHTVSRPTLQHI